MLYCTLFNSKFTNVNIKLDKKYTIETILKQMGAFEMYMPLYNESPHF